MYSVVVPVYRNAGSVSELLKRLSDIDAGLEGRLEAVFVVDGSPDDSYQLLQEALPRAAFSSRLILLSRNFGSFAAIRAGLGAAKGPYYAVMAADLQEPGSLVEEFLTVLEGGEVDVVIGSREGRSDPWLSRFGPGVFWWVYRRFVQPEIPRGGVDVFGCNQRFRDQLIRLDEANTSLVGLMFWLGFRRHVISYRRLPRRHGRSAWSVGRKLRYLFDSFFGFTDLPVRLLIWAGAAGLFTSMAIAAFVAVFRVFVGYAVPGFAFTVIVISFFAGLNSLGLGIIGSYVWRAFENSKRRPLYVVMEHETFGAGT
jgi:glycosyltransferase involved in cell wall biosynthesis